MATKKKNKKPTKSKLARGKKVTRAKHTVRKATAKKAPAKKRGRPSKPRKRSQQDDIFEQQAIASRSGAQSGDLQGLRETESADSESVEELAEEGNAFEAEAVAGVEHADDDAKREVHTHEVPEDDVPEEYLDKE
jgi:hypothetical protein